MRCKKCLKIDRKGEAAWQVMVWLWLRYLICIRPIGWHGSATCNKCVHTVLWSVAREDGNRESSRNLRPSPLQGRCHDLSARRKIMACSCGENTSESFLSIQLRKSRKLRLLPVCASSWFPQWWHCRSCQEPRKAVGFLRSAFSCWISACGLWSWNPPRYRFHSPFLGRPAKEDLSVRFQSFI